MERDSGLTPNAPKNSRDPTLATGDSKASRSIRFCTAPDIFPTHQRPLVLLYFKLVAS